jgi:hypothetical protein
VAQGLWLLGLVEPLELMVEVVGVLRPLLEVLELE